MGSLDKSAFLLRLLTRESSYKSVAADEKAARIAGGVDSWIGGLDAGRSMTSSVQAVSRLT